MPYSMVEKNLFSNLSKPTAHSQYWLLESAWKVLLSFVFSDLQWRIDNVNNTNMIISGDCNYPGFDWSKRELKAGCPYPSLYKEFRTFLEENSLTQLTTEPTRHENTEI